MEKIEISEIVLIMTTLFSTVMPAFVIFLILTQSPKSMREYQKFLINFTVS